MKVKIAVALFLTVVSYVLLKRKTSGKLSKRKNILELVFILYLEQFSQLYMILSALVQAPRIGRSYAFHY